VNRPQAEIVPGCTSLVSRERGNLDNEFIEITEDEANQIVARIRARVTGQSTAKDA
jgi:hypothetical protein